MQSPPRDMLHAVNSCLASAVFEEEEAHFIALAAFCETSTPAPESRSMRELLHLFDIRVDKYCQAFLDWRRQRTDATSAVTY